MSTSDSENEEIKKPKVTISRSYHDALKQKNKEYWDYENFKVKWNDSGNYDVLKKVGRGKYSEVFEGTNNLNEKECIIKILK